MDCEEITNIAKGKMKCISKITNVFQSKNWRRLGQRGIGYVKNLLPLNAC